MCLNVIIKTVLNLPLWQNCVHKVFKLTGNNKQLVLGAKHNSITFTVQKLVIKNFIHKN